MNVQSLEGRDEGWSPGQRFAASRGQERQPCPALLREAHQGPPLPHRGAPPQTTNSTILYISQLFMAVASTATLFLLG